MPGMHRRTWPHGLNGPNSLTLLSGPILLISLIWRCERWFSGRLQGAVMACVSAVVLCRIMVR